MSNCKHSTVSTPNAPAIPSFSQATTFAGMMYTSGQVGMGAEMSLRENNFRDEVHRAIDNLEAVLVAGGSSLSAVLKTTCYLSDMSLYAEFDAIYQERFTSSPPSRSTVQAGLARDFRFEIEAIAYTDNDS